jgi:hypothetical protein
MIFHTFKLFAPNFAERVIQGEFLLSGGDTFSGVFSAVFSVSSFFLGILVLLLSWTFSSLRVDVLPHTSGLAREGAVHQFASTCRRLHFSAILWGAFASRDLCSNNPVAIRLQPP